MALDINTLVQQVYTGFAGQLVTAIGTDSKELMIAGATYLADAKTSLVAIGIAALSAQNPMSWQEVKRKLLQEGEIAKAAFLSVEQLLASDIQSFVNQIIAWFENLLTGALVQLQASA